MKKILPRLMACAALLLLGTTVARAQGQPISTTPLLDLVAAARGKVVVLNFFASFCPPCRMEIPGLMELRSEFSSDEVEILGISVDSSLSDMENFIQKYDFNYPVYYGGQELGYAFRIAAIPHNVVYDRLGRMAYNQPGYLPKDDLAALLRDILNQDS